MKEPIFITEEIALGLHRISLEMHGGLDGIRDKNQFGSALSAAWHAWAYGNADLHGIASCYAYHLAESQAFLDGNKRTAAACAATFLLLNGCRDESDDDVMFDAMIAIARRELDKAGLAVLLRKQFPLEQA
jgi:death-on-curing protein